MKLTDLEDLLKTKIVKFPSGAVLYLFILDQNQVLRTEFPGATITEILTNNDLWIKKEVKVLPNPLAHQTLKQVIIMKDPTLAPDEFKFVYFDPFEVAEF